MRARKTLKENARSRSQERLARRPFATPSFFRECTNPRSFAQQYDKKQWIFTSLFLKFSHLRNFRTDWDPFGPDWTHSDICRNIQITASLHLLLGKQSSALPSVWPAGPLSIYDFEFTGRVHKPFANFYEVSGNVRCVLEVLKF